MKRYTLLYIVALWMYGSAALAQTLTVDSCRTLALQSNKTKQQARLKSKQAELTRKSTRALFFPDFSLTGGVLYDNGEGHTTIDFRSLMTPVVSQLAPILQQMGVPLTQLSQINLPQYDLKYKLGWMYSGNLMLKQPIYMGGKIRAAYEMSQVGVEMAKQNERLTDARIIAETDEAYAMLVKSEELVEVASSYLRLLEQLDKNVESAVRHGMRMDNDRMKVQVKMNEASLQLLRARNGVTLARMNLCRLIGRPLSGDLTISHEYPVVEDVASARIADVSNRPELALLEGQVALARGEAKIARSAMLPQVALLAKYGYTQGLELNNRTLLDGWNFAGGVTVNVPLYHFGERQNKLKAARLKQQEARLQRDEKMELMLLELAQAGTHVDEAAAEVALAQRALEQAERNMTLSKQQYEAGFETLSDYLEAQALWQQAYERKTDAHFRQYLSGVAYLKAAGALVP
ncbi:MAG: TolC family protein [Prevotellaceae bacterium]|nr:TolC family protein [Prevotellaceae bacterium]